MTVGRSDGRTVGKMLRAVWLTVLGLLVVVVGGYGVSRLVDRPGALTLKPAADTSGVRLVRVVDGLESPVHLAAPAGDARLFVALQNGWIRIVKAGALLPRPFLNITDRVGGGGERGLLSVAFHPEYGANGRFFVYYTDRRGDIHIAEFHAAPGDDTASAASERVLLTVRHPTFANHNGGQLAFGPDGALYAGTGDGGGAGDAGGNAQDGRSMLGKLLRIDVGEGRVGRGERVTTWAIGLRNPWRFAFDSGLLYIADVGQNAWEEIDVAPARDSGLNYGWRTMEGAHCFINPVCSKEGLVMPAAEYGRDQGCSVTGGVVYRGRAAPVLAGSYLYSDYCNGWLKSFRYVNGAATGHRSWAIPNIGPVSSFGVDGQGEVYMVAHSGSIHRITGN